MKTKTGLLAVGVFTIAGALTVSCGGSSDNTNDTSMAGSTSANGGTSSGSKGTAGNTSSAGTTDNGGTTASGGRNNQGGFGQGGFNLGAGGAAPQLPDCPAAAVDGAACTPMNGGVNACQVDTTSFCLCQGQTNPVWVCPDLGGLLGAGGAGGAGGLLGGTVTCPATAMSGDDCTGLGVCPGAETCGCLFGKVICQ